MTVSSNQKIDLLYKQAFGVTKTDTETNKSPSNEAIASPLLLRGDTIWLNANDIPAIAATVAGKVTSYTNASAAPCVADITTVPIAGVYPTWKTGLTNWIPAEFGASYNVSVYIDNPGAANPSATGTQIFAAGSGGTGEFYFNYVSGVLNFIGGTIPAGLVSGKVLYISGYRYTGPTGINNFSPGTISLGNLSISNNSISAINTDGNIELTPNGVGNVIVSTNLEVTGNITGTDITATGNFTVLGNATFGNLDLGNIVSEGAISSDSVEANSITVTGTANVGNLDTAGYVTAVGNVTGGNLVTPGDVTADGNIYGNNLFLLNDANVPGNLDLGGAFNADGNVNVGNLGVANFVFTNLIPSTTEVYTLGNSTNRWKDIYLAGNSIILGNTTISSTDNDTFTTANANVFHTLTAGNATFKSNVVMDQSLAVAGNLTVSGTTTYINVTDLNISDPIIELGGTANGGNATAYDSKDRGLFLHNYDGLNNSPVNQYIGWKTANNQFEFGSNVSVTNGVVSITDYGNVKANVFLGNLSGQVLTAAQTNITSLGNLTGLTVDGNLNVTNTANIGTLKVGTLTFPADDNGSSYPGQVLSTYGNGTLYFATIDTFQIQNGTSNVYVYEDGNITISSNGNANVFVVTDTGVEINGSVSGIDEISSNTVQANVSLGIGPTGIQWAEVTTTSIVADQVIASVSSLTTRGVEFFVRGVESAGAKYSVATLQAVHDDTTVDFSNYGTVVRGGTPGYLSVIMNGSNIELVVTPSSSNSTVWTTQYRTI
jgi:hypothetical protein